MENLDKLELISFPIRSFLMWCISRASRVASNLSILWIVHSWPVSRNFALPQVYELTLGNTWNRGSQTALVQFAASPTLRRPSFDDENFRCFGSEFEEGTFVNLDTLHINFFRPGYTMEAVRYLLTPTRSITELTPRPPTEFSGTIGLPASSIRHLRVIQSTAAIVAELSPDRPVHHVEVLDRLSSRPTESY